MDARASNQTDDFDIPCRIVRVFVGIKDPDGDGCAMDNDVIEQDYT